MLSEKQKQWFKNIGIVGFLFFLFKGLAWIAFFAGIGKCAAS